MSNILIQYDWNNHKEVNQKKLTDMFMKLCLSDRKKVYRILSPRRKHTLRKGYEKWKVEEDKVSLSLSKEFALEPLSELIDISDLKTHDEVELTIAMIAVLGSYKYYDNDSSNYHKEAESFEKAKEKMIGWIRSICMRKYGEPAPDLEDLISRLEQIEYVPPKTLAETLKEEKEKWKKCYMYIGVGKERAARLAIGLTKHMKLMEGYSIDNDTAIETREAYEAWKYNLNEAAVDNAIEYLNYILSQTKEDE